MPSQVLRCGLYHHYYHYQSSAQYLWLARALAVIGAYGEARTAYEHSVFQDHFNEEALEGLRACASSAQASNAVGSAPSYAKHPLLDLEFCRSVGEKANAATALHDAGVARLAQEGYAEALILFNEAVQAMPQHSNSHFGAGKCHFLEGRWEEARSAFTEAIRLSHLCHDAYHRSASAEHLVRGREFLARQQVDLAISDFTKALDLHRKNKAALAARAQAYRLKENTALAEQDEHALARLPSE